MMNSASLLLVQLYKNIYYYTQKKKRKLEVELTLSF